LSLSVGYTLDHGKTSIGVVVFLSSRVSFSGFTDSFYKEASARLMKTVVASRPSYYITAESPQYWFQANEVWEVFTFSTKYVVWHEHTSMLMRCQFMSDALLLSQIRGAELSLSPVHQAAAGNPNFLADTTK
jgi:hypothetical protein